MFPDPSFSRLILILVAALPLVATAAEVDHSTMNHSAHQGYKPVKTNKGRFEVLTTQPQSGKAREAGFDGRYAMEPTSISNTLATRCAQASRGLIMLDNVTWARCGGKPKGVDEGPAKPKQVDHSENGSHAGH